MDTRSSGPNRPRFQTPSQHCFFTSGIPRARSRTFILVGAKEILSCISRGIFCSARVILPRLHVRSYVRPNPIPRCARTCTSGAKAGKTLLHKLGQSAVTVKCRRIHFQEARAAVHWPALRRIERNRRRFAAFRAVHRYLDPLSHTRNLGGCDRRKTLVLRLLAFFAALGWIEKFLV